jgi:hypothetical protein
MKTSYGKIGMRYAILMVLGMALAIVAKPNKAFAITPCQQACVRTFMACHASCKGDAGCIDACGEDEGDCIDFCKTGL